VLSVEEETSFANVNLRTLIRPMYFCNLSRQLKFLKNNFIKMPKSLHKRLYFFRENVSKIVTMTPWSSVKSFFNLQAVPELSHGHQGSMLWTQSSAIFDNFRRKNWRFFLKNNDMIIFLHNSTLFWVKQAIFVNVLPIFCENIFLNHNIGPRMGEFSPTGQLFSSCTVLKIAETARIYCLQAQ
jgi:hypothetical protein